MKIIKNKYDELRSGWAILSVVIIILVAQVATGLLVGDGGNDETFGMILLITLMYGLVAIGGGIVLFKLIYKRRVREIGLIREGCIWDLLNGVVAGSISMSLVFISLHLAGQVKTSINIDNTIIILIANFISLCVFAFSEELLTRGFMMTALKTTRNKWIIFCGSSLLFSLLHLLNSGVTLISTINTFLAGLLFAYMFIKSGKLWLPSGYHIAWNFLQGDVFGMNVSGSEQFSVFNTTMGTNSLLTGGSYGPEGGILVTIVLFAGALYVRLAVKTPKSKHWTMESDMPLIR